MSIARMNDVWERSDFFPGPRHLLLAIALADSSGNDGASFPKNQTLARRSKAKRGEDGRYSDRPVRKMLLDLEERGLIYRHPRFEASGRQTSSMTFLTFPLPLEMPGILLDRLKIGESEAQSITEATAHLQVAYLQSLDDDATSDWSLVLPKLYLPEHSLEQVDLADLFQLEVINHRQGGGSIDPPPPWIYRSTSPGSIDPPLIHNLNHSYNMATTTVDMDAFASLRAAVMSVCKMNPLDSTPDMDDSLLAFFAGSEVKASDIYRLFGNKDSWWYVTHWINVKRSSQGKPPQLPRWKQVISEYPQAIEDEGWKPDGDDLGRLLTSVSSYAAGTRTFNDLTDSGKGFVRTFGEQNLKTANASDFKRNGRIAIALENYLDATG